jgi:hypothetical protein
MAYGAYDYNPDKNWCGVDDSAQEFEISKKIQGATVLGKCHIVGRFLIICIAVTNQ